MTALDDIFYESYRLPLLGDSFSTIPHDNGYIYDDIHIGSTPLAVEVISGDAYLAVITEPDAEETDECIIGGAPIQVGRVSNRWFVIERPVGTADADVEFFYKGNLFTAKRFGTKIYL